MKQYYSYEEFKKDTLTLLKSIKNFEPQAVVGVARGGLTLSHALAEGMSIREVQTLRTELYDGSEKRHELTLYGVCEFSEKKRVLVVDDIADSGETLECVMGHLERNFPEVEFKSLALFYKKTSSYEPHFWVNEATEWIDFFWEADFRDS